MKKVRVGILGCGGYARNHARRYLEHPNAQVVALCDVTEDIAAGFRDAMFGAVAEKPALFTDAAKMYRTAKLDAVSIVTPHTLHFEHCCQGLAAGCHVLVEKPMVTRLADAVALEKKVAKAGKILCIGYNTSCSVEFRRLREIIRSGELGKLKVVSIYISQPWYFGTLGKWRQVPELSGGGMIYDSGAHVLNSLVWTVESDVREVHAWIDNFGSPVDVNGTINVKFTNDVLATVAVSGVSPNGSFGVWMFESGRVEADPWGSGTFAMFRRDGARHWRVKYPSVPGEDSNPVANFVDAILGRAEPGTSPRNGVQQSQLMDAVYESARTGQPARPPKLRRRGSKE
jgi:predicted dehydrogenase